MRQLILLLSMCFLGTTQAWANAMFTNEPAGLTSVVDCNFDTQTCNGQFNKNPGSGRIVTQSGLPTTTGTSVLEQHFKMNSLSSIEQWSGEYWKPLPSRPNEVFMGFWWRMNSNFGGLTNGTNKLWFIKTDMSNSFFGAKGSLASGYQLYWNSQNNSGMINAHLQGIEQPCSPVSVTCWLTMPLGSPAIILNNWIKWEVWVKRSTTSTMKDGSMKVWKNGTLIGSWSPASPGGGINWGNGGFATIMITQTWDSNVSGDSNMIGRDLTHWIDHMYVSISGGGGGGPDTTSPSPPSNLTVN